MSTAPLTLNWLVPEPFPGAGGDVGLFRIIRHLAEFGHACRVYVVPYNLMNDYSAEQIRAYVEKHFGPTPARYEKWAGAVEEADATFATFWPTAENVLALPNGGRRFYLVQDFEPSFYPGDAHHTERAENTYRAGFHCITLGPWLARLLHSRYGATTDYFDFAVDTDLYWPRPRPRALHGRVCFYARPATPRRGYELGLAAFEIVKKRRPEIDLAFFGAEELTPAPTFPVRRLGQINQEELAQLFSQSDVGVVFSLTNPSFVPLEMMACRCAVVEIASERWDGTLTHARDAWLVEPNAQAVADGIEQLLEDKALRDGLVERAYRRTQEMSWQRSAAQIERVLLRETRS